MEEMEENDYRSLLELVRKLDAKLYELYGWNETELISALHERGGDKWKAVDTLICECCGISGKIRDLLGIPE